MSQNLRGFLNILSRLTTVELYLVFNLERHLCALEIERQEAVQKHEELRSAFLAREVVQADNHIRDVIEIASHQRPELNYQNDTRTKEQRIADGLAFANNQRCAVRLKLAFCMTCAFRVLVLAQGPSFLGLRRALLRQRRGSQDERSATLTSGGVETIQRKCSTSTEENKVVWMARPLQVSLVNQEVECDLIAQEVKSAEYRRRVSSTYTTRAHSAIRRRHPHHIPNQLKQPSWCPKTCAAS